MRQHVRSRIEPAFGWLKTIAWMRTVKLRGLPKVDWLVVFASAAFNLIRLLTLLARRTRRERRVSPCPLPSHSRATAGGDPHTTSIRRHENGHDYRLFSGLLMQFGEGISR